MEKVAEIIKKELETALKDSPSAENCKLIVNLCRLGLYLSKIDKSLDFTTNKRILSERLSQYFKEGLIKSPIRA